MKIIETLKIAAADRSNEGVTIAFLGDSVTQGCFEIYRKFDSIETVFEQHHAYSKFVGDILRMLYPNVPINILNAGKSGDRAPSGLQRLEKDVLRHEPDLVVVCYGLNDCRRQENSVEEYTSALAKIFAAVQESGSELIFMTPNMMNTALSPHVTDPLCVQIANDTAGKQNDGLFDAHMDAARCLCREMGVTVCDCYSIWKKLYTAGVDTTELLSNKINHPTREMNRLFAYELVKTMFEAD